MTRLLLPFTQTLDESAIEAALILAQQTSATLVACSLTPYTSSQATREIQSEQLLHYKEFMEVVQQKAWHFEIPVERIELTTQNTVQSIHVFAQELECAGIVLFLRDGVGVLLETDEIKHLLVDEGVTLYLMRLPVEECTISRPQWRSRWFSRQREYQSEFVTIHNTPSSLARLQ